MKTHAFALVAALAFTAACSQTDAGITTSVKTQLAADDLVKARNIDVDTNAGVVTLTGTVESQPEGAKALQIARSTDGVANVVDNLSIVPSGATPTSGRVGEAAEAIGGAVTDSALTADIKTRFLADPMVKGLTIDVDTKDRVVTLIGDVGSQAEKNRALEIARGVDYVARVEDS